MAPQVGLEPTTLRLTAECSAIELLRNMGSGGDLLSRTVTSQVPSALKGLTSVFGMGTGVTPSLSPPEMVSYLTFQLFGTVDPLGRPFLPPRGSLDCIRNPDNCTAVIQELLTGLFPIGSRSYLKSSPRPISIIKLHTLPYFHR